MRISITRRRTPHLKACCFAALFAAVNLMTVMSLSADEAKANKDIAAIQGKWTREHRTKAGVITIIKTHGGQSTTLTALDPAGKLIYEHTSDFKIERAGKLRIFTYFNKLVTAGPDKGKASKTVRSYVYRVVDDHFVEVHGLQEGDKGRPLMVIWKRVPPEKGEGEST